MNKRFGKKRVPGCRCTHNFTCGECLKDAPLPPIFTPSEPVASCDHERGPHSWAQFTACAHCGQAFTAREWAEMERG